MHPRVICERAPFVCLTERTPRRLLKWPSLPNHFSSFLQRGTGEAKCVGRKRLQQTLRQGASTVEFAIVAPVFFLVVLSLIQFAGLLMSQNVLTAAAREGGRVASMPSTLSTNTVVAAAKDRALRGGIAPDLVTVNVNPTVLSDLDTGAELRISVSAPISEMGWFWAIAPPDSNLATELTYYRE